MTVSLRVALVCVIGSAVTGCGAAPDTEGRLKELEAQLEAQSLLVDDLTSHISHMDENILMLQFSIIENNIKQNDRWNHVAPPGLEGYGQPALEYAADQHRLMSDYREYLDERHDIRKVHQIHARRNWAPLHRTKVPPLYTPMVNHRTAK